MLGSVALAIGLTAIGDRSAQAGNRDKREHARLAQDDDPAQLRVLDWTLWNVSKYYVESKRVEPAAMTLAGLEALEAIIPEVLVEPTDETKAAVRVRVGTTEQVFPADANALWAVGPQVRAVFSFVNDHATLTDDEQREAEYAIVEGVLSTLDPHTNLLRPAAFEDMRTNTAGAFGGLGIEVGMRDNELTVLRVLPGNPAARAGLQAGDKIVQIDDESTVTMTLNESVGLMRGPAGTEVAIYVRREGLDRAKRFDIERAMIKLDSVTGDILPGKDGQGRDAKIGLLQIPRNFSQTTSTELRDKLRDFERAGVTGIVLDMRDNPGGLLNAAVEVVDAFVDTGTIVSTVGESSPRDESKATGDYRFADVPLVVLVDQGSASATEIVAGALRNLDRAVILGRRTFGKGSVQVLHDRRVADTELALKLTIAQYLTPGDVSIQSVGVSPDLETIPVYVGKDYLAYYGRKRFDLVREESLSAHLVHSTAQQQQITAGPLFFLQQGSVNDGSGLTEGELPPRIDVEEDAAKRAQMLLRDPEIRMARDLALWAPSHRRSDILANLPQFTAQQVAIEDARIAASLGSKDVDWAEGPAPTDGKAAKLEVSLSTDKRGDTIAGGESGVLTMTVTNAGDAPAYRVRALSDSDYNYFDERELMFGRIDPGETKTATLKLSVSAHELSRTDRIDFHLLSQHDAALTANSATSIDVSAKGVDRPKFAYGYQVIDDPKLAAKGNAIVGNGDGLLQVGERVHLRVWVQNAGPGDARDTRVQLRNGSGDAVFLHSGRIKVGELKVGKADFVDIDFEVQKPTDDVSLQLTVSDAKIGEYLMDELSFPISAPLDFRGEGGVSASAQIDLYAGPYEGAPVLARAEAGASFATTGNAGGWYELRLGKDQVAYAKASALTSEAKAPRRPGATTTVYPVSPPRIELQDVPGQTADTSITLSGVALDGEAVRDVYVTVQNPSRNLFGSAEKISYVASKDPSSGRLEFSAEVPLEPGNNYIEIVARENGQVSGRQRMWVLRTSGLAEARAKEASFQNDGSLAVDTFNNGR
ncbi:carboxyl-terminal protease family protein [Plesiocystis pacifica SIR-1]|uniref:Carboxyl-terminal protease family protein n=1 Tax=Plesiocystis pacifica SIR-1 TaxID=391625 RepID=A6GJD0_9BACT|nr:carboxyl-terminal protease family protein [Plesiocystis pacifica SIR-1]